MPLLRESQRSTSLLVSLRILNVFIMLCGALMLAMVIEIQGRAITSPGWCLIILGVVTILAGVLGIVKTSKMSFIASVIFDIIAAVGSGAFALALFSKRTSAVKSFPSRRFTEEKVDKLFSSAMWVSFALSIAEVLAIFAGIMIRQCDPSFTYETLEETERRREVALGKIAQGSHNPKSEKRAAKELTGKMKKKYGQWSHENWG